MRSLKHHRHRLWVDANGLCHWCGDLTIDASAAEYAGNLRATVDHVDPSGSHYSVKNMVLSCDGCNRAKSNLTGGEWQKILAIRLAKKRRVKSPRYGADEDGFDTGRK